MNIEDIERIYKLYNLNNTLDYNYEYTRYKMRNIIDIAYIYNNNDNNYIDNACIVNNIHISNSSIISNCNINNINIHNNFYNNNNITIINKLTANNLETANITNNNFINVKQNYSIYTCNINNNFYTTGNIDINNILTANNILVESSIFNKKIDTTLLITSNILSDNLISSNNLNVSTLVVDSNVICLENTLSDSAIVNNFTNLSSLFCNELLCNDNITINSDIYISNNTTMNNFIINNDCFVSDMLIVTNDSNVNDVVVKKFINCKLEEYYDNETAGINGIVYGQLYRTGGIVKIRTLLNNLTISLNQQSIMYSYINNYFNDPLFNIVDNTTTSYTTIITGDVDYNILNEYNLSYQIIDSHNNKSNILTRIIYNINYPTISNINLLSGILTFDITGTYSNNYNVISFIVYKNNVIIQNNTNLPITETNAKTIDINNILLDDISHTISILIRNQMNEIIKTINVFLNIDGLDIISEIDGYEPYKVNINYNFNIFNNIKAYKIDNTLISLSDNNFDIYDNFGNNIQTTLGDIIFEYNKSYNINFFITGRIQYSFSYNIEMYDTRKPVIALIGNSIINISKNSVYTDLGYEISDISNGVIDNISGYVNTSKIGTYYITYTAVDHFLNKNSVVRQVNVI